MYTPRVSIHLASDGFTHHCYVYNGIQVHHYKILSDEARKEFPLEFIDEAVKSVALSKFKRYIQGLYGPDTKQET